jgi:hypothetical protein
LAIGWPEAAARPPTFSPQKTLTHKTQHFVKQATFFRQLSKIFFQQIGGAGVPGGDIDGQRPMVALWCRVGGELVTLVGLLLPTVLAGPASTAVAEEIRGDDLAPPDHFKFEEHVGYTTTFDPKIGTSASQQALFAESELAYGLTEWWDVALTTPYSFSRRPPSMENGNIGLSTNYPLETGGVTVRQMFLQPDREERDVYYGLMVRFGDAPPGSEFSDLFVRNKSATPGLPAFLPEATPRYFTQISPIVSWKFGDGYQLLFNSNFNIALGSAGSSWEPNFRFVKENHAQSASRH